MSVAATHESVEDTTGCRRRGIGPRDVARRPTFLHVAHEAQWQKTGGWLPEDGAFPVQAVHQSNLAEVAVSDAAEDADSDAWTPAAEPAAGASGDVLDDAACRTWEHGPHPQMPLVVGVAIAAVALGAAWPTGAALLDWLRPPRRTAHDGWELFDTVRMGLVQAASAVWVFVVGAAAGSFLNVVIHRLPAGRSVIFGRSACPTCGTGIRPRDNVPILGWLLLGGRCRQCGVLINPRYALVEASLAGLCLGLCYAELMSGGMTLPLRDPPREAGLFWTMLDAPWDLVGTYLYHVAAVALLITWSLIAADGRRIPAAHVVCTLGIMALLPMAFPWLHPVPLLHPAAAGDVVTADQREWLWRGLMVSLAGMALGVVVGAVLAACGVVRRASPDAPAAGRHDASAPGPRGSMAAPILPSSFALVGTVFGWQAVPAVALLAMASIAVARAVEAWCTGRRRVTAPELFVVVAVVVHLVLWRWIVAAWSAVIPS